MKPVKQTKFGQSGNCVQAVLASLLETELEVIPDFMNMSEDAGFCFRKMNEWLIDKYEIYLFPVSWLEDGLQVAKQFIYGYWIGDVRFNGLNHVVIMKGKLMVHDPAGRDWSAYKLESAWIPCKVMT